MIKHDRKEIGILLPNIKLFRTTTPKTKGKI